MPKVFVEPIGLTLQVDDEETLLDALVRASVEIPTDCAGRGTCGKYLVRPCRSSRAASTVSRIQVSGVPALYVTFSGVFCRRLPVQPARIRNRAIEPARLCLKPTSCRNRSHAQELWAGRPRPA